MSWLIPKIEEHDFEDLGFKIKIIDKSKGLKESVKAVKIVILDVCRKEKQFIRDIGDIEFILVGSIIKIPLFQKVRKVRGWVYPGKIIVHLDLNNLTTNNPYQLYRLIYTTIVHEIFHLHQYSIKKSLIRDQTVWKKLRKLRINSKNQSATNIRVAIGVFFHDLLIEGLAKDIEFYAVNPGLHSEKQIEAMYIKSKSEANEINDSLSLILDQQTPKAIKTKLFKKLRDELKHYKYSIGEYMCVRTKTSEMEENTETLVRTNPLNFIKKYEAAEIKSGNSPVVSLNSKKGILDYNSILVKIALSDK